MAMNIHSIQRQFVLFFPSWLRIRIHRTVYFCLKIVVKVTRFRTGKGYWNKNIQRKGADGKAIHGESSICRERVLPYCLGKGIDIGCGPDPVTQEVVQWDFPRGDAYDLSSFADESFDFLFSSHCLEHLFFQTAALAEWMRVIKVGGRMILYLPHPDYYFNIGWGANGDHCHDCFPEQIIRKLRSSGYDFQILSLQEFGPARRCGEWSFQLIVQKENLKKIE